MMIFKVSRDVSWVNYLVIVMSLSRNMPSQTSRELKVPSQTEPITGISNSHQKLSACYICPWIALLVNNSKIYLILSEIFKKEGILAVSGPSRFLFLVTFYNFFLSVFFCFWMSLSGNLLTREESQIEPNRKCSNPIQVKNCLLQQVLKQAWLGLITTS